MLSVFVLLLCSRHSIVALFLKNFLSIFLGRVAHYIVLTHLASPYNSYLQSLLLAKLFSIGDNRNNLKKFNSFIQSSLDISNGSQQNNLVVFFEVYLLLKKRRSIFKFERVYYCSSLQLCTTGIQLAIWTFLLICTIHISTKLSVQHCFSALEKISGTKQ